MKMMAAVLLFALSLLTVVSPNHESEELVILCGDEFYEECKRLTEESLGFRKRRHLSDSEEESADSAEGGRVVRSSLAKRQIYFMPLTLGVMKQTCCELGCNERFMRDTCK